METLLRGAVLKGDRMGLVSLTILSMVLDAKKKHVTYNLPSHLIHITQIIIDILIFPLLLCYLTPTPLPSTEDTNCEPQAALHSIIKQIISSTPHTQETPQDTRKFRKDRSLLDLPHMQ
jgi:hypothetical protein